MKLKTMALTMFLAAMIYTGVRHTSALNAERALIAQFADWQDQGLFIDHGKITESGFPYRIVITIDRFSIKDRNKGFNLKAKQLSIVSHVWTPNHWLVTAKDLKAALADGNIRFTDETVTASLKYDDSDNLAIAIDSLGAEDFEMTKSPYTKQPVYMKNWFISAVLPKGNLDQRSVDNTGLYEATIADFRINIDGVKIGSGEQPYQKLQSLGLLGRLTGTKINSWTSSELTDWSNGGGLVEFNNIQMAWGKATASGSGSFSLDESMMPLGSLTLSVNGGDVMANYLANAGYSSRRILRDIFPAAGQTNDVSFMMQNGFIQAGNQQLGTLSPVIN